MHSYPMLLNSYCQQTVKDLTYSCCCSGLVMVRGDVASSARTIMNNLLADILHQAHNLPKHRTEEVAIFSGLNTHRPTKEEMLLVELPTVNCHPAA